MSTLERSGVVVIGGVAAGMSAASKARRQRPDLDIVVFERGPHVSYGACGIPYNIEDPSRPIDDLVVISAEQFRSERGIDVRTQSEVTAIDTTDKIVHVRNLVSGESYRHGYDKLVIATGATAVVPPLNGIHLPAVFRLRELTDGERIKEHVQRSDVRRAVIVGGGYIGLEMAEVLRELSLQVVMVEMLDHVIPAFDPAIAAVAHQELLSHGVRVLTGAKVKAIEARGDGTTVCTESGELPADLVLIAVGVRPNVVLARAAGVALGPTGAIAVDDHLRTSVPDVFAAGDCAEAWHLVGEMPVYVPLGTTANKQGKVAGANAAGGDERFGGIVGTAGFKVFDVEVARTGLGRVELDRLGIDAIASVSQQQGRGHHYPGSAPLTTALFVEPDTGRLLGAQMAGKGAVATRIDVFAAALHAGMSLSQIEALDLAYAPPFAPVYDPILIAATVARKDLAKARARRDSQAERRVELV